MSRRTWVVFWLAVLMGLAFNGLWLLRPAIPLELWWATVVLVNAGVVLVVVSGLLQAARWGRRTANLQRTVQRLELLTDDREREARVLETIGEVSRSFLNQVQIRTLLDQMATSLHRILAVDAIVMELLPENGGVGGTTLARGASQIEIGDAVREEIIGKAKSLLINDIPHYPRYAGLARQGFRAMIVAPFKRHERVIGLIGAFARSERSFTGRDLNVLFTFATHTALLVEGAALLDDVRRLSLRTASDQVGDLRHLRERLSVEREVADRESAVARRIQAELLPRTFPELPHLSLDAVTVPAREVGGDFFDIIPLGKGSCGIAVADVAGKGVPAALVMVMAHTLLRAAVAEQGSPREVLLRLNNELFEQTTRDCFVSLFYGVWDDATRTLRYANAGHEPPVHLGAHGARLLPRGGIALGALDEIENYLQEETLQLGPADALLLYTDGAHEATNASSERYGLGRLVETLSAARAAGLPLVATLCADIDRFVAGTEPHDDITLVALQVR